MTLNDIEAYLDRAIQPTISDRDVMKYLIIRIKHQEIQLGNLAQRIRNLEERKPLIPIIETEANHQQLPPITDIT